jgi:hypothetical protein
MRKTLAAVAAMGFAIAANLAASTTAEARCHGCFEAPMLPGTVPDYAPIYYVAYPPAYYYGPRYYHYPPRRAVRYVPYYHHDYRPRRYYVRAYVRPYDPHPYYIRPYW